MRRTRNKASEEERGAEGPVAIGCEEASVALKMESRVAMVLPGINHLLACASVLLSQRFV